MPNNFYYGKWIANLELHRFELNPIDLIRNCPSIECLSLNRCVLPNEYKKDVKIMSTKHDSVKLEHCLS